MFLPDHNDDGTNELWSSQIEQPLVPLTHDSRSIFLFSSFFAFNLIIRESLYKILFIIIIIFVISI